MKQRSWTTKRVWLAGLALAAFSLAMFSACGSDDDDGDPTATGSSATQSSGNDEYADLSGSIDVDGSSTVGPITEAVAEEFGKVSDVNVSVGISGTSGGFEKFCKGETAINDASRPIKDEEETACADAGIEVVEFKVAIDGLTVAVQADNDFVECLTFSQLKQIWDQGSTVQNWSDVDPSFPAEAIEFYSPGADSGTFDYFTEEVNGTVDQSRTDGVTFSENDRELVQGVENNANALGYFGYAYYQEATGLKAVAINKDQNGKGTPVAAENAKGCVEPTDTTIADNSYPLSRPLFIYVNKAELAKPEVRGFVKFYLENTPALLEDVAYIPLPDAEYEEGLATLEAS